MTEGGLVSTAFFDRTYDEALALTVEARDYVAQDHDFDLQRGNLGDRLYLSCETMRLTSRMTYIMSWIFFQRAVHEGEIGPEEVRRDECRLGGADICLDHDPDVVDVLPAHLRDLMERSLKLYQRIARLDEMLDRDLPGESGVRG